MVESKEVGPRPLVQGLIPPESQGPAEQPAGREGQGHPQQFWLTAARPGVVFFLPLDAAANFPSVEWMLAKEDGSGGTSTAGGGQGHPQSGGRTVQNRVAPSWPAGSGQGHSQSDGRPVQNRVAP